MADETMSADVRTVVRAEIDELNAAHMADEQAKRLNQAQQHRFVEKRVWEAERRLLARVPELLSHADALAAENAALRGAVGIGRRLIERLAVAFGREFDNGSYADFAESAMNAISEANAAFEALEAKYGIADDDATAPDATTDGRAARDSEHG